jgi:ABC-type sugar transport system substrate-binding protein
MTHAMVRPRTRAMMIGATAVTAALLLAGCNATEDPSTAGGGDAKAGEANIALVPGGPNVYFAPWEQSAKDAQSKFKIGKVSYVVPPTQTFETAVQITTLNSLASQGVNGMAVFPDGATAMQPAYQRIADQGVSTSPDARSSPPPPSSVWRRMWRRRPKRRPNS